MNNKKNEIFSLENKFESKINFYFNAQYSLHDPIIEIDEENNLKDIEKINVKKKSKTTKVIKKKRVIKTKKSTNIKDKVLDNTKINTDENIETQKDINLTESEINEDEEKTGWWS